MRLIDADALMRTLGITDMDCGKCRWGDHGECIRGGDFTDACFAIEYAPTVEERKIGEWVNTTGEWINITNDESLEEEYKCSVCGYELFYSNPTNFCPNCGARIEDVR